MNLLPSTAPNPQQTQTQNEHQLAHHQQTQIQQNTAPNPTTNDNPMHNDQINNDHEATLDWFENEENNPLNANHGPDDEFINNIAMFPMVCVYAKYITFSVLCPHSVTFQSDGFLLCCFLSLISWLLFACIESEEKKHKQNK